MGSRGFKLVLRAQRGKLVLHGFLVFTFLFFSLILIGGAREVGIPQD